MAQWLDLSPLHDEILSYVDGDDWKSYDLMLVNTNWWKNRDGTTRYQVGTIVLIPMGFQGLLYQQELGKTFATVIRLLTHSNEHNISPDQYKYVERPTDIQSYRPITNQVSKVLLQQFRNNGLQLDGQPVCYKNVSELDLSNDSNLDVDINKWRSLEMEVPDLYEPDELMLGTNGATFAAYLFLWFFPNVTSINLSRTKWSNYATALINFPLVEILFWQNCLCTSTIFLSDLDASVNLIELQLNNSTICLPLQYQGAQ